MQSFAKHALALVAVAGLGVALTACGSDDESSAPAASSSGGSVTTVDVKLVSGSDGDECQPSVTEAAAGPVTFTVTNESAAGIAEFELISDQKIIGEKENLAPGLPAVSFTVTLGGGDYVLYCPGATEDTIAFTVTGEPAPAPTGTAADLLNQGAQDYAAYVSTQVDGMVVAVQALQDAVDSGDLEAAKKAYAAGRPFYEHIESDVDGFVMDGFDPTDNHGNLDYLIDMRESNLDPEVGWSGFHLIEKDLFEGGAITDDTKQAAADLTENVTKLADLSKGLEYKPEDLANGAAGLLEEVQSGKISGEEELYSHLDLAGFAANVEGAEQAFANLKAGLREIDPDLVDEIADRFADVKELLYSYRDADALGGYQPYTEELKASDANKLSQSVQSLQDVLSSIAAKVATAS